MPRQRWQLVLAFAAIYLIWGSTYLGIRWGIETIPPFLMAAVRFIAAGTILTAAARLRGAAWPTRVQWRSAAVVGVLLLTGGNGGVTWAELRVPSGHAALIVGAVPMWVVLMDWVRPGGTRPGRATIFGVAAGLVGLAVLVNPTASDAARMDPVGTLALIVAELSWAAGTIYSRHAPVASPLMSAGANMLCGGAGLTVLALLTGDPAHFAWRAVSAKSLLSLIYLIVFGAAVAFTAYVWLLRHTTPTKVSTYAYVNPVVAVFLGWLLADEPITPRVLAAAAVITTGVVAITAGPALRVWLKARTGSGTSDLRRAGAP